MGLTQPLIYQQNNVEISQAGIVHTFGSQVFVNDLGKNDWEIWAINRLYGLRFNLDLNTMQVGSIAYSKPSRSGHLPLKLPYIIQKRKYELDKLYQEIGKNAMLGFFNYSMGKAGKYCWRVQSKSYSIAFEYVWNIKDGSFSDLKVFKRKAGH